MEEVVARHHAEQREQLRRELATLRAEIGAQVTAEADRVVEFARGVEIRSRRDLFAAAERRAAVESAVFAGAEMAAARSFPNPTATLKYALSLLPETGMVLEFGVSTGSTLKVIVDACPGRAVYGFDSFRGLPEDWRPGFPAGAFDVPAPPEVPGAKLVVGLFADTLPAFLAAHPEPVAFLHVDADLYSSASTVLELVGPRLKPGSVIVFDEYFNYPGWPEHEHKAWREHVAKTGLSFRYAGYTQDNEQVIVLITGE